MIREQKSALMAARLFNDLVGRIDDSKWSMTMPPEFKTMSDQPWTLRDIINYHAYDDAWIPDMLAGRTMAEVGESKWKGDLLGDDPKAAFSEINNAACIAIEKLDDPERTAHLSFGDYTAQDYLLQVISFRGLRYYDISKALGLNTDLPAELVDDMWDLLTPHAEEWRQFGVYDPALPVPSGATPQQRLLATLGYDPS
jgi:uncharacterized protein (TIGR03086 family)